MVKTTAIELLHADRRLVMHLLDRCGEPRRSDAAGFTANRAAFVARLCVVLRAQLRVAQEIFYPEVCPDAADRHEARMLCGQTFNALAVLADVARRGGAIDYEVSMLREAVMRRAMFDDTRCAARIGDLDLEGVGDRMAARRASLVEHPRTQGVIARLASLVS